MFRLREGHSQIWDYLEPKLSDTILYIIVVIGFKLSFTSSDGYM